MWLGIDGAVGNVGVLESLIQICDSKLATFKREIIVSLRIEGSDWTSSLMFTESNVWRGWYPFWIVDWMTPFLVEGTNLLVIINV